MKHAIGLFCTVGLCVTALADNVNAAQNRVQHNDAPASQVTSFHRDAVLSKAERVYDYIMAAIDAGSSTDRNWVRATLYAGIIDMYDATGDAKFLEQTTAWAEKHAWQVGTEPSGMNRLFCAMTWAELYRLDPDPARIAPTLEWLATDAPNSPGSGANIWFGHGPEPFDEPVYSDSLYGVPVFTLLYKATGDREWLDMLHHVFWTVREMSFDEEYNLFYRDPTFIGHRTANDKKLLWSRGNGWVFAAFPRFLPHLPEDFEHRDKYLDLFQDMAASLAASQQEDGFWRANLADPFDMMMPESSGTAFFTAGLAWGVRSGLLDRATYLPVVIRAWNALGAAVHENGRLGWVQPVDAAPRPSHPYTTQQYAVGGFLNAAAQMLHLIDHAPITAAEIAAALPDQTGLLPPAALKSQALDPADHPLYAQINAFVETRELTQIEPTGLGREDYLDVIAGQVRAFHPHQNEAGRILDPVSEQEWFFTTPCYAHSVAVLVKAGYDLEPEIVEGGMRALDVALADMAAASAPGDHGDFFTWPIVLAMELFDAAASVERRQAWQEQLGRIDPEQAYTGFQPRINVSNPREFYARYRPGFANNWNLVNTAGEFARSQHGHTDVRYVDDMLLLHLNHFNQYGQFNERGNPLAYDLFSRYYLASMLERNYCAHLHGIYRNLMWRGAWTSLFMQSPHGELPTGHRSSHHIWNEAQQAVLFEIYAHHYAKAGKMAEAGAFKRAAHLSLSSIKDWIRPDGSGYVVKNRYPAEEKHGYERYSRHSCYNLLATSMLAQAWQYADDTVQETPSPADVGGFVFFTPEFRKIFANAGGSYIQYDTSGDLTYNPTGLLRVHLRDGHPQLGPSDGCAAMFSGEDNLYAVGPAWQDADGNWTRLAALTDLEPTLEVLEESTDQVRFRVAYQIETEEAPMFQVSQTYTLRPGAVEVEDRIQGDGITQLRVYYPMLVFDGDAQTDIQIEGGVARLKLRDKQLCFQAQEPANAQLIRTGKMLDHRNGIVEPMYFETPETIARYRISVDCHDS